MPDCEEFDDFWGNSISRNPYDIYNGRSARSFGPKAGWVNPHQENRTKSQSPYAYSEFYHWKAEDFDPKTCSADYSDRLSQWDSIKYRAAWSLNKKRFEYYSPEECSKFLTEYYGKPIEATALVEGCNPSNGYEYYIFFYKRMEI
jgi:hypothetical protein